MSKLRLILDSNRLFAALIRQSLAKNIILNPNFEFFAPDYVFSEIMKHKDYILDKSKLLETEFEILFDHLFEKVTIIPFEKIQPYYEDAKKIMDPIDPDDSVFLALAMCISNDGIWTGDKDFEKQNIVKVWTTLDLLEYLEKIDWEKEE